MAIEERDGWRRVASRADIAAGEAVAVSHGDVPVVLVELAGEIHALNNVCPHAFALMSDGFLDGEQIECPLHGAVFDVRSGKCLGGPVEEDLPAYDVRLEGDDVWVRVGV